MSVVDVSHRAICGCLAAGLALAAVPQADAAQRDVTLKPVIQGFIDMQAINWHNKDDQQPHFTLQYVEYFPGLFAGIVLNATWNEMQPKPYGRIQTGRIERALEAVRAYNTDHPSAPLGVKLRIFSGNQAPEWAKDLDGGPIAIKRNPAGCSKPSQANDFCTIHIGKVWGGLYMGAWRRFQNRVAAIYDSEPLIRSVAITSCTMETDEPFVLPERTSVPAGYTDAAGRHCLRRAVDDYAGWVQTPIDYTINVFENIQTSGADPHFSVSVMDDCRAKLGPQCELGNHAFSNVMPSGNAKMVLKIAEQGAPIHYQTAGPSVMDFSWSKTMKLARARNATAMELWPAARFKGFMSLSMRQMQRLYDLFNGSD